MDENEKVRENRLRRMAQRQGLSLVKSRRRDHRAVDFGTYMLVDSARNAVAYAPSSQGFGADLDDIEKYLTSD